MSSLDGFSQNSSNLTYLQEMGGDGYGEAQGSGGMVGGGGFLKGISGMIQGFMGLGSGDSMVNMGQELLAGGTKTIQQGAALTAGTYREAGKAAIAGSQFEAKVYRQAGQQATLAANYNIALDQYKVNRANDAVGRELTRTMTSNTTAAAANGLSLSSRSTLAVQTGVLDAGERQVLQMNNDAKQRQSMIAYEGELTKVNYENQARAAEYQGQVANQAYENQARITEYQAQVDIYKLKVDAWKEEVVNQQKSYEQDKAAFGQIFGAAMGMFGG